MQIDTMYLDSNLKAWNSSRWIAPPPEEIARIRAAAGTHDAALAEEGERVQAQQDSNSDAEQKERESGETEGDKEHHSE